MTLRIWLLGGFRVQVGDPPLPTEAWRRRKAADLLKVLALAPGQRLHREVVLEMLWPHLRSSAAANNLHSTLYITRRLLSNHQVVAAPPVYLALGGDFVCLSPAMPTWVDVDAFRSAAAAAHDSRDPGDLAAALQLYRGELLPENRYDDWVLDPRDELRRIYLGLLLDLAGVHLDRGQHRAAGEAFRAIVASDPANEEAHVGLMRLYMLTGQRGRAVQQYQQLQASLQRDLEVEPDADSQRLYQDLLAERLMESIRWQPSSPGEAPTAVPIHAERDTILAWGADMRSRPVLARPGVNPTAVREGRDSRLTPREREVAVLLARGYTNVRIAAELQMSVRTADTHVSRILQKLGLTSRAELAGFGAQPGLSAAD